MKLFKLVAVLAFLSLLNPAAYAVDAPAPKEVTPSKVVIKADPKVTEGFTGPTKPVKPGQTVILDYNGPLGLDPKFQATPKPENFRVFKDFAGNPAIVITPGDDLAGKTIIVAYADNKDGKTILATYAIEVLPLGPQPPPPGPGPLPPDDVTKLKYFNDLKAANLVSPNAAALDKLIEVYTEIGSTKFTKRSEAASVLKTITAKKVPDYATLRKVRDTVQHLLETEIGTDDTATFDQAKFEAFWKDITIALAAVKAGK